MCAKALDQIEVAVKSKGADLVKMGGVAFQLNVGPEKLYIDLKNGSGATKRGGGGKAVATVTMQEEDFLAMAAGKLDAPQAYMEGKLKISGTMRQCGMLALKLGPILGATINLQAEDGVTLRPGLPGLSALEVPVEGGTLQAEGIWRSGVPGCCAVKAAGSAGHEHPGGHGERSAGKAAASAGHEYPGGRRDQAAGWHGTAAGKEEDYPHYDEEDADLYNEDDEADSFYDEGEADSSDDEGETDPSS